ncbi:14945_t:CDS:2 [Entrophospora sp. SA101]|nr:14945_t:CDS:2 [Entrophospora sp. SA101]
MTMTMTTLNKKSQPRLLNHMTQKLQTKVDADLYEPNVTKATTKKKELQADN